MNDNLNPGNIIERAKAPTPKFFKKLRNIFVLVGSIGGIIASTGPAAPAVLAAAAPWLITIGSVGAGVSQLTKEHNPEEISQ